MRAVTVIFVVLTLVYSSCLQAFTTSGPTTHRTSAFFPSSVIARIRVNAAQNEWGRALLREAVTQAEPWKKLSDEQLWGLMFGATIPRSWHVLSNGACPACKKPVPMYDWKIDALAQPWKVRCPNCQEFFPKNDFAKFYATGLDAHGVFDPAKADRKLLFNTEHPDAKDPLHVFGVEDGTGYFDGKQRWRFISTYLVFGQWKQAVELGIKRLATAYLLTGDASYAHKAAVLLDRVADLYPTFDFQNQGLLYESAHGEGYVTVWHDSTIETREMAFAYDAIKSAIVDDAELARFLSEKSRRFQTPRRKETGADVTANIEQRILRDALANPKKIYSNYPQQFLTEAVIRTALDWPANREQVFALLDPVIEQSTAVDGTTGEKGMANYSCYAAQRLAEFLGYYTRADDTFLPEMVKRHPRLPGMWKFFIDTWCADQKYYPLTGDTMHLGAQVTHYAGASFLKDHGLGSTGHMSGVLAPSMYSFLWQLYGVTQDPAFVQVLYKENDRALDGLPFDLFADDPAGFRKEVKAVIDQHGAELRLSSVNEQEWRLAILRSGQGAAGRAAWLDYDAGGNHGHLDGMTLGLFAKGLDLAPDFGYVPVQFGGWGSPRATWYVATASHNTVLVNGAQQTAAQGKTTLWGAGNGFSAISASAPELYPGITKRYERSVALVDVSAHDSYVVDLFRVAGGKDHAKFFLSHFGTIQTAPDLKMERADDFAHPQMRNFKVSRKPPPGWSVTWKIEDHYKFLAPGADVRVRYTDFTTGADAYICEAWAVAGEYNSNEEVWLPRVMVRHQSPVAEKSPTDTAASLESNFVSLIEPYEGKTGPLIRSARRLPLEDSGHPADDSSVALAIELADGRSDILMSNGHGGTLAQKDTDVITDAKMALIRRDPKGSPVMVAICGGSSLVVGPLKINLASADQFIQLRIDNEHVVVIAGKAGDVRSVMIGETRVKVEAQ